MMNTAGVERADRAFYSVSAMTFMLGAALTVAWCGSMSGMPGMEMPGGWRMSMAWMRMPGQTWPGAAATFIGMWSVMMMTMMMPVLVPMLVRFRLAVESRTAAQRDRLTVVVAAGYFTVWTLLGVVVYPFGVALAWSEMVSPALARIVPLAVGAVVLAAGVVQLLRWKLRLLSCCARASELAEGLPANARAAWRHGLQLGVRCVGCCASLTAILLVLGVMDPWLMLLVTAGICLERLAPNPERVARGIGVVVVAAGILLVVQAS
jgi:predicted metal-binding membrane protein